MVTPSIIEHITQFYNEFILPQQQSQLFKLKKDVTDKQRRDEVRDK